MKLFLSFLAIALGNHYKSVTKELSYFKLKKSYYEKTVNQVRFIVLDSEQEDLIKQQAQWLKHKFKNTKQDEMFILVYHHPPVTLTKRHHWWEKRNFHNEILPIIKENQHLVDLVLIGHDHIASLFTLNNIPYLISGAAMEVKTSKHLDYYDREREIAVLTRWKFNNKDPYWARLDINPNKDLIWINFVNSKTKKVDCSIKIKDKIIFKKNNCF